MELEEGSALSIFRSLSQMAIGVFRLANPAYRAHRLRQTLNHFLPLVAAASYYYFSFSSSLVSYSLSSLSHCASSLFTWPQMSASLPGDRELPHSQYDLNTYWGRVRHAADISDPR
jgi:hypothetical protein